MGNNSRTKNSAFNLATSLGGQLLTTFLRFVTRTVFIHTLGKSFLGINGLFSDILTMLSLTELGIDTAINFQLYKPLAVHDDKRVRVLIKFYKQAYRIIGFVIFLLGLCLIPLLPILIRDYDTLAPLGINATLIFILYLLQSVTSYLFFAFRSAVMKASQKQYVLDVADYAVTIVTNVCQILVLVFLRDFVLYTATVILFNIIKNFVNAKIAKHYFPQFLEKEADSLTRDEVLGLFKDCGALFFFKLNYVVLKATDNLVISSFIGLSIVGVYSNYLLFYNTIRSFLNKVYASVKASLGNLFAAESMEKRYSMFCVMNYLTILLYGTAAVGIAICTNEVLEVWIGTDYVVAQPFSILVGIEILFNGLKTNLEQIRNVSGVFRQIWYRPIISVITNLVVSIVLVQVSGIYGVIIGTIFADLFVNFMIDPGIIHKYSFNNFKPVSEYYKKNLMYIFLLTTVGALDFWLCGHVLTCLGWFSVLFHVSVVLVSVPGTFFLVYRNEPECRYLLGMAGKIVRNVGGKFGLRKR